MSRRHLALGAGAAFVLAFVGSLGLHHASALHDTDAYYHLTIARIYAEEGVVDDLPQLRLSLLRDGFGDKEFLFHFLLAPLAGGLGPLTAGRLGLAVLAALLAAAMAWLSMRAVGWWGIAVPFWLFYASTELAWRVVRLRPELLSLLLLLVAAWAMGTGRDRLLGVVAFVYTLSYTAFQALLGTAVLCFAVLGWKSAGRDVRRWPWRLPLYASLGSGLGLLLHPHFPKNLEVWLVQNVQFFLAKGSLDVGTEIRPNTTDVALMVNLGWFLGLAVLVLASRPEKDGDDRLGTVFAVFALAFGGLYVLMSRFSLYFVPFATLWCLSRRKLGGRLTLPGGWRPPLWAAAGVVLLVSLPEASKQLANYHRRTDLGPNEERIRDREAFSAAMPEGAHVVADWGPTATYLLWAPQGLYLNALDPVFMATPYPEAHRLLEEVLEGREPDVPAAAAALGSAYLAMPWNRNEELLERLDGDPRVAVLYRGLHHLVGFRPSWEYVLDWRVAPGVPALVPGEAPFAAADVETWPPYPRHPDPWTREVEAYVDGERIDPAAPCVAFARQLELGTVHRTDVVFAPWGPSAVWVDGDLRLEVRSEPRALPGHGLRLPLELEAGRRRILVVTCEGPGGGRKGFYWREGTP